MTARQALDDLADFFARTPDLELATVARPSDGQAFPEGRALSLGSDAEAFFRTLIRTVVIDEIDQWSLRKLDPVYKPDYRQVEWSPVGAVDAVRFAINHWSNLSQLAPFAPQDDAYKRRLLYWVCALTGSDGSKAFFFRAFTASAELQRKRGAALVSRDGAFHRVEESIFIFKEAIDCFVFGGYVFVLRKNDFRRIFDQFEAVRKRARRAAQDLHARVPIANFDEFVDACTTQAALADKLLAVCGRDYFNTLSYELLKPIIDDFKLGIPTRDIDGQKHLVFGKAPDQRFRILKLVDDDYLRSTMTNHRYEVNSKTEPPG